MKEKLIKNIPNMITSIRLIMSIIAPIAFFNGAVGMSVLLYGIGALSDCIDGFAARKLNAFTKLGKKLDGLSDKLFALSLLTIGIISGNLLLIIPMLLEGRISVTNLLSNKLGLDPTTEQIGRLKTILLFPTLILGAYAPIVKEIYYLLVPLLIGTTALQLKCIKAYDKQFITKVRNSKRKKKTYQSQINEFDTLDNQKVISESKQEPVLQINPFLRDDDGNLLKPKSKILQNDEKKV